MGLPASIQQKANELRQALQTLGHFPVQRSTVPGEVASTLDIFSRGRGSRVEFLEKLCVQDWTDCPGGGQCVTHDVTYETVFPLRRMCPPPLPFPRHPACYSWADDGESKYSAPMEG